MQQPNIYWIDLFCGGGGTTTGIHLVNKNTKVLACINHDKNAIASHKVNHPFAIHFTEDIRDWKVIEKIKILVENTRRKDPGCIINLWASLECTNFSIAKGGGPKNADSRSLANHMKYYIEAIDPDYFYVENVREFLTWGPLNSEGKPIKEKKGIQYHRWEKKICTYGYHVSKKILNSADFGSYQARRRLFIIFAKKDLSILWPEQTHAENGSKEDLFGLKKWKPVKEILDLEEKGNSIFTRKKALAENTLKRILAGLIKFVPNQETNVFISNYKSGHSSSKNHTVEKPIGTISTIPTQSIVSLQTYYGKGGIYDLDAPSPTVTTKDRIAKVEVNFLDQQFTRSNPISLNQPCNALTTVPKFSLVSTTQFLYNPQYSDKGRGIEEPCFTLIARMDKKPPSIITVEQGIVKIYIEENDSKTMIQIKEFMVKYNIIDIKMRMLNIDELKQIQGFPKNYVLIGTSAEQKKFIGNAVDVNVSTALAKANTQIIKIQHRKTYQALA